MDLTPNQVAAQLAQLSRDLDALVTKIDEAEKTAINAREDYTMAYAKTHLSAEGSIKAKDYKATIETQGPRLMAEFAEQNVKSIRRQIDSVRLRVEIGRTLAATLRTEMHNFGAGAS